MKAKYTIREKSTVENEDGKKAIRICPQSTLKIVNRSIDLNWNWFKEVIIQIDVIWCRVDRPID